MFAPIITMDEVGDEQKPSPKGLEIIKSILHPRKAFYLGDTMDDIKAGVAADIPSIGVLPPQDKSEKLKDILQKEGAVAVLDSVTNLMKFLEK